MVLIFSENSNLTVDTSMPLFNQNVFWVSDSQKLSVDLQICSEFLYFWMPLEVNHKWATSLGKLFAHSVKFIRNSLSDKCIESDKLKGSII